MTMKLKCPICGNNGILITKTTITKTATKQYQYEKWYVYHNARKESKQKWCYLSKNYLDQPDIKEAITKQFTTQNTTQKIINTTQKMTSIQIEERGSNITQFQKASLKQFLLPKRLCMNSSQQLLNIPSKKRS